MSIYNFENTKKPKSDIKRVKLSYKPDEPTMNNRIYKKSELIKALDKLYEKQSIPIVRNSFELSEGMVRVKDMIGLFTGYEITSDNEIFINVRPVIDTELFDNNYLNTFIIGTINNDNIVKIDDIIGFFIAGKQEL